MILKKFTCKVAVAFLIVGGITLITPAADVQAADSGSLYDKEIQQNPKDVDAYFHRGLMYSGEDNEKAIADFSMVIKLEPDKARGYLHRGIAYRNLAQYDKAVQDFDKAISLEPQNALNYLNRGTAHYYAKNYDKARADFNSTIRKSSGNSDLNPEVQKILKNWGVNLDYSAQGYYGLGLVDYEQKNYQSSLENFNKAIKKVESSMFYESRAKCYKALGDNAKAQSDLKKAAELKKSEQSKIDNFSDTIMEGLEVEIEDDE